MFLFLSYQPNKKKQTHGFFYVSDMRRFMVLQTLLLSRQIQMLLCLEVLCPRKFHQLYCFYQAAVWRKALKHDCQIPSPNGNGWIVKGAELTIHWMDQDPATKARMELVSCKCKSGCNGRRCSYHKVAFYALMFVNVLNAKTVGIIRIAIAMTMNLKPERDALCILPAAVETFSWLVR